MKNLKQIWIVGCGDIGKRVAAIYEREKAKTSLNAIVSSSESLERCKKLSIDAHILDLDSNFDLTKLNFSNTEIYYFAPPPPQGTEDIRLKRFLAQLTTIPIKRFVLISTTGVYGDSAGAWIDESTAINPHADRAIRRASAEQTLQSWAQETSREFMILRVPGIYAEDRLPVARLEKGLPIVNAHEAGFTNRIHADDLAQACIAAMNCEVSNEIINVTDGNPSTMTEYFNHVADYLQLSRPPQISMAEAEQALSAGMVSYLKESRRIKNEKMLDILNIELEYPDLNIALKL